MQVSLLERYRGAMVGTLVGDAMGAPVEWQSPEQVEDYFSKLGGYQLHDYLDPWALRRGKKPTMMLAGQPTDDSELAAALAQSLIADPMLQPGDLYVRLRSFIHGRKAVLSPRAYGQGGTLKAALEPETFEESAAKFIAGEVPTPPSNGSLMRNVASALVAYPYGDIAVDISKRQSLVTHRNELSVAACMAGGLLMQHILDGVDTVASAWSDTSATLEDEYVAQVPALSQVVHVPLSKPDYETEMLGKEGYVVLSLRVALWAAIHATDFADGVAKAISVGGDTDTYAAILGGFLGAHYGLQGIPQEWQEKIQGRDVMLDLADKLYSIARS